MDNTKLLEFLKSTLKEAEQENEEAGDPGDNIDESYAQQHAYGFMTALRLVINFVEDKGSQE
jgi:hypothetical protein